MHILLKLAALFFGLYVVSLPAPHFISDFNKALLVHYGFLFLAVVCVVARVLVWVWAQ